MGGCVGRCLVLFNLNFPGKYFLATNTLGKKEEEEEEEDLSKD